MRQESTGQGSPGVTLAPDGLQLGSERLPLLSGAMHYYHIPREHWPRCLDAICELGLSIVESYVPWAVHERGAGEFHFGPSGGRGRFESDLEGFLTACEERGLRVLLRPGPHINGEMTHFGFPERILQDKRCLAVGAQGNPVIFPAPPRFFPVPSYASERFLEEAEQWLQAVARVVGPRCWPQGPVVGVQVDNENCMFFRTAAYDQDYHPDALKLYRQFLEQRYPEGLPRGYGQARLQELEPPCRLEATAAAELVPHLDWVAFKEHLVLRSLERLAEALRQGGVDQVPLFHNQPATNWGAPCGGTALEGVLDFSGLDLYQRGEEYLTVKRNVQLLAGSSRFPTSPELGCGGWPWWFPLSVGDHQTRALSALMHGVKGFNLYMVVERDRWYGAPVSSRGAHQGTEFPAVKALVSAVKDTELFALDQEVKVALVQVRALERLGLCTSLLDPLPPMALSLLGVGPEQTASDETFGLSTPVARHYARIYRLIGEALDGLQVAYHIVDSDAPSATLERYALLVVPSFDFMERGFLGRLESFVEGGGALALGPQAPHLDEQMEPLNHPLPAHRLLSEEGLQALLSTEIERLVEPTRARVKDPQCDLTLHLKEGRPRVLFLANRSPEQRVVAVEGVEEPAVWDAISGDPVSLAHVNLGPHQVRMLCLGSDCLGSDGLGAQEEA